MLKIETDLMIFFLKLYLRVAKLGEIKKFSDDRNCWTFRVLRLSFQGTLLISCIRRTSRILRVLYRRTRIYSFSNVRRVENIVFFDFSIFFTHAILYHIVYCINFKVHSDVSRVVGSDVVVCRGSRSV